MINKLERALELAIEEMDMECVVCPYSKVCSRVTNIDCKQKLKEYFIYVADDNEALEEINRYNFIKNLEVSDEQR